MKKFLLSFFTLVLFAAFFLIVSPSSNKVHAQVCAGTQSYTRITYTCGQDPIDNSKKVCVKHSSTLDSGCTNSQQPGTCRYCRSVDYVCTLINNATACDIHIGSNPGAGLDGCITDAYPVSCAPTPNSCSNHSSS